MGTGLSKTFPADPELEDWERQQYLELLENRNDLVGGLHLQALFLLRRRLNQLRDLLDLLNTTELQVKGATESLTSQLKSLNSSSRRIEWATVFLLIATVLLVIASFLHFR
jgi:hypothetical protein